MCQPLRSSSTGSAESGTGTIPPTLRSLVPDHPACTEALRTAEASLLAPILNHSFRVFLYAYAFVKSEDPDPNTPDAQRPRYQVAPSRHIEPPALNTTEASVALFVACILHDVGTARQFDSCAQRFEVSGADAAAELLNRHGFPSAVVREAWLAIAVHSSAGIAEGLGGIVRAVRLAVLADFHARPRPSLQLLPGGEQTAELVDTALPRLDVEKALGDRIVDGAMNDADPDLERVKAPRSTWPGGLVRAKREDPGWTGVNRAF
ncbi:hypothetical protein C8A03DRAFT_38793 [Achaetomium macrosporum]|uniref:HD domain-containing protein n=1 Tax=Achaetomium macrosporum TaxID=79813 RepID=A0AAN7C197_9PEZI|nr:hypothetical protein C8A03DRAFT_38793 [Achaetomium macrosporum]